MKVIKKINNNVAVCIDNNGNELVAFGKGIGFPSMPYELTDLNLIRRTYYNIKPSYLELIDEIPEDIIFISEKIVDYARTVIKYNMNPNIVFTLADHINFAIYRYKNHLRVRMPLAYDIQHLYEDEMMVGKKAVAYINHKKKLRLSKEEAAGIAIHIINSGEAEQSDQIISDEAKIIEDTTQIIEEVLQIKINKEGFNYSRFVTHLQYLLKRRKNQTSIISDNRKIYMSVKSEYPQTFLCVDKINQYFRNSYQWEMNSEEQLYLILHINRVSTRENDKQ